MDFSKGALRAVMAWNGLGMEFTYNRPAPHVRACTYFTYVHMPTRGDRLAGRATDGRHSCWPTIAAACSRALLFTCAHSLISPQKPSCPRDGHEQIEANRLPEFRSTLLTSNPFSVNVGAIAVAPAKVLEHRDTRGQERGDALVLFNGRRRSGRGNSPAEIIVKVIVDNVDVMSIICNGDGASGHTDKKAALVREAMKMRAVIQSRLHSCVPAMNLVLRGLRLFQSAQRNLAVNRWHVGPDNPARGTADGFFVLHGIS